MRYDKSLVIIALVVIAASAGAYFLWMEGPTSGDQDDKLNVLASFYPLAYMVEEIGGEKVAGSSLIPPGSEVHSWQPSISDVTKAEKADVIIYNGAGLDHWVEDNILGSVDVTGKIVVKASQGVTLLEMEEHEEEDEHEEGDPHLWVSPHTAILLASNIAEALKEANPDNSDYYDERWIEFEKSLRALDERYAQEMKEALGRTFFVTHSAYGYLADRYGLEQHGVIGLSADEQPSTAKIVEIVEMMLEEQSYVIYVDPVYSDEYARTLKAELETRTGKEVRILELYVMVGPVNGKDYMDQLEANLENLSQGLTR